MARLAVANSISASSAASLGAVAFEAAAVFVQLAAAALDEFGQLGAAGVHRLTLAAEAFVAVLLGGDACRRTSLSVSVRVFSCPRAVSVASAAVVRSDWWPSRRAVPSARRSFGPGDAVARGLAAAFGVGLFAGKVVRAGGEVLGLALDEGELRQERGNLHLTGLEHLPGIGHGGGGGLRTVGGGGAGVGEFGNLFLAGGGLLFECADLRLPLEDAGLRGMVARAFVRPGGSRRGRGVRRQAWRRSTPGGRLAHAGGHRGGLRRRSAFASKKAVEQRGNRSQGQPRRRAPTLQRSLRARAGSVHGVGPVELRFGIVPGSGSSDRAADLFAGGEGVEEFGGHLVVAQEDRL